MRKKGFKGRCEKRKLGKSKEVCRTYDTIQYAYADILQARKDVAEIRCNVPLDGCDYTTDFLCIKTNNDLMIRECIGTGMLDSTICDIYLVNEAGSLIGRVISKSIRSEGCFGKNTTPSVRNKLEPQARQIVLSCKQLSRIKQIQEICTNDMELVTCSANK